MKHLKLSFEKNHHVMRVTISRPEVRNAFNDELISEFHSLFTDLSEGKSEYEKVRAVLLHGAGTAFCGGGDLNWMRQSLNLSADQNLEDCQKLTRMFLAMDRAPVPVIGLVHGFAIGGGVGLVSICDHVIAETETIFSLSEVKLGLIPACIGPFVIGKIGTSHARSLFVSGERFSAQKALQIGLVHEIANAAEMESRTDALLKRVLEGGPYAVKAAKFLIHTLSRDLAKADFTEALDFAANELAQLRVRPEAQEGVRAFLEKRTPSWRA